MARLILLKNIQDFECALKDGLLAEKKIVTFSFGLQYKLMQKKICSISIWEYLDDCDLSNELNQYKKIVDCWHRFFTESKFKDYKNVCLYQLITFSHEALYSILLIRKLIKIEKPSEIINYTSPKNIPCVEGNPDCSIFDSIIEYICQDEQIKYTRSAYNGKAHPQAKTNT